MKPYYETKDGKLYLGSAIEVLKHLPDDSANCCVTSPPYWGLRDYGTEPQIWDSEPPERCVGGRDHVWGDMESSSQFHRGGDNTSDDWKRGCRAASETEKLGCGNFCQVCNAWKGSLGLEPTPELYVKHIVDIFREIRRVLRDDGTLWLNLGDSYSSGGRGSYDPDRVSKSSGLTNNASGNKRNTPEWAKPKDLIGIPWMVAFALRADGWYLRQDIVWHKPNPMPESVKDRCTKAHEYIFLLSKSQRYYYDFEAMQEDVTGNAHARGSGVNPKAKKWPSNWDDSVGEGGHGKFHKEGRKSWNGSRFDKGKTFEHQGERCQIRPKQNESFSSAVRHLVEKRNKRSVWTVSTKPFSGAHFATFPPDLIKPCILAGCPEGGTVLDPFMGAGTTAIVAYKYSRKFVGIELSQKYLDEIAIPRIEQETKQLKLF